MRTGSHVLAAFNIQYDSFVDNVVFAALIDRVGKHQLTMQKVNAYEPMATSMPPFLREEAFHLAAGVIPMRRWVEEAAAPDALITMSTLRRALHKWYPRGLEMFGDERGGDTNVRLGLKDKTNRVEPRAVGGRRPVRATAGEPGSEQGLLLGERPASRAASRVLPTAARVRLPTDRVRCRGVQRSRGLDPARSRAATRGLHRVAGCESVGGTPAWGDGRQDVSQGGNNDHAAPGPGRQGLPVFEFRLLDGGAASLASGRWPVKGRLGVLQARQAVSAGAEREHVAQDGVHHVVQLIVGPDPVLREVDELSARPRVGGHRERERPGGHHEDQGERREEHREPSPASRARKPPTQHQLRGYRPREGQDWAK